MPGKTEKLEIDNKVDFIKEYIEISIKDMKKHRKENQRRASIIKVSTLVFSSLATILLGVQLNIQESILKNVAFVFSAIVTLLNAMEPFFNFRALWIEHEQGLANMYRLQNDLDFYLAGRKTEDIDPNKIEVFRKRYEEIWNSLNENYIRFRRTESG
jgi:hypothetical protein